MRKRIATTMLALGLVVSPVLIASPAQAHSRCSYHFYDAVCVSGSGLHYEFTVCDREADGNRVWGVAQTQSGAVYWRADTNGSAAPCYTYSVPSWDPIVAIWAYEDGAGYGEGAYA